MDNKVNDTSAPNTTPQAFSPSSPLPPAEPAWTPAPLAPVAAMPPAPAAAPAFEPTNLMPQPVVKVLSPRGVEYVFMTIALLTGAIGLGSALLALVNGETGFEVLSFPAALLLVSAPIFAWLFLRLKNAELQDPALRFDASKRRSTQFIQISSFVVGFFTIIGFITAIFAKMAGKYDGSLVTLLLDVLVIVVITGGLLAYYWRDEHRSA